MAGATTEQSTSSLVRELRSRAALGSRAVGRWLRSGPVSLILSLVVLVVFIVSLAVGRPAVEASIVSGAGHAWWTVVTAISWSASPLQLVAEISVLLTIGIWLERSMGSGWYLLVGFATYSLGALITVALIGVIDRIAPVWGDLLMQQQIVGIAAFLIGVGTAASVRMVAVWRRRVRTFVISILLVMPLFAGSLGTLFTLVTALLGLVFGVLLWGKDRDRHPAVMAGPQNGRALVAVVVTGIVFGTLISLRSPEMVGALSSMKYTVSTDAVSPDVVEQICSADSLAGLCAHYSYLLRTGGLGSNLLSIMPLITQLVLAWGLRGGRLAAWWGTIILQSLTAAVALIHLFLIWREVEVWGDGAEALGFNELGHPTARFVVPIVVPLVLLIIVFAKRSLFTVRATQGTYQKFWRDISAVTLVTLLITLIIGVAIGATKSFFSTVWILTTDFFIRLLPSSVLSLVTPEMDQESAGAIVLMSWTPLVPWLVLIFLLLQSFGRRQLPNSIGRDEYISIVKATEAGSMGWITTWPGNQYWKSSKFQAAVAYRADRGVALTVSDPAALSSDLPEVLEEFGQFASEQGLIPAFYSVHAPVVAVTDQWKWLRLEVAEETVLLLPELEFKGKRFQDVRTAINRAAKEGIHTEWTTYADCKPAIRAQIKQISADWVSDKPLPEMGFTLGGIAELDDPEVRILLALDDDGTVHGVTSWMPIYDEGVITGWTLDFMRRLSGGFRPVMEYLIASAALWAKDEGYEVLSLSGAPLAHATSKDNEQASSAALDQVLDVLGQTLEPVYGFRSLLHFKAKFLPEYAPIYLAVPTVAELPTAGLAIAHAYLPQLTWRDTLALGSGLRADK